MNRDFCKGCVYEKRCDKKKKLAAEQYKAEQRMKGETILNALIWCEDRNPQFEGLEQLFDEMQEKEEVLKNARGNVGETGRITEDTAKDQTEGGDSGAEKTDADSDSAGGRAGN